MILSKTRFRLIATTAVCAVSMAIQAATPHRYQTRFATIQLNDKGFIVSIKSKRTGKEYSPEGHPSPLMSLGENGKLISPTSAVFQSDSHTITLNYPNAKTALVSIEPKDSYFRLQLVSLAHGEDVDNIVWGPCNTTISGKIGDLLGVVRDDDWAIGMLGLDDNTIAGPPVDSDCYGMGYYVHSQDKVNDPLPAKYKEGQWFNIGGNGISDTAFYSHPEGYFHQSFGTGAKLEPEFGSSVAYHSRDRSKPYTYKWSLLPGFERSRPRQMVSDPVPGVGFKGSGVALYACPDSEGLKTIEKIIVGEGLPHIMINGKWIRDPSTFGVTLFWNGPYDKCLEYAQALGVKDISRDTGEFYPCLGNNWSGGKLPFTNRPPMEMKEFTAEAHRLGLSSGGLHTLTVFLQPGTSNDVTPVPSKDLQAVCRTKLAKDISPTDTEVVVTDPSFLADKGTWTEGDDSNYLRIGSEMLRYTGISKTAPWTLTGVERGHGSKALPHKAGDEVAKLMQNCYNGFVPDIAHLPAYADYYADLACRNGLDGLDFDGFESTVYQNQGYYAVRLFCRHLFDTYAKLSHGKALHITGSNVFTGAWEYMNACNVGGGDNMFVATTGRRGIEGKDIGDGFSNSYFPATFGGQWWHSDWSVYDAENLQAKAVGWDATYGFNVSQEVVERSGEKDAIFKTFRAWQDARADGVFSKKIKQQLRDPDYKFHLERKGPRAYDLFPIKEINISGNAGVDETQLNLDNPYGSQPLQFSLRVDAPVNGLAVTLPNGSRIQSDQKMDKGQFLICKRDEAYVADQYRKKLVTLAYQPTPIPEGKSKFGVRLSAAAPFTLTVWTLGRPTQLP
ncbi:MAG TPA: hypothetical protein VGL56_02720 [Fimbriimonadaceae bacterium]|jgi:hypothetical protein